ncbi:MAG: hypothetical protein LBD73_09330 [Deferribacteraceae bacterium]|jgi:hypothetical protein|nr:hypothetical protein [Deferribacteraceae bacterium]
MKPKRISFKLACFTFSLGVLLSFICGISLHIYTHLRIQELVKGYLVQKSESIAYSVPIEYPEESDLNRYALAIDVDYVFIAKFSPPYEMVTDIKISGGTDGELKKGIVRSLASNFEEVAEIREFYLAYKQVWQFTDTYAGVLVNKERFNKAVTAGFFPLIFLLILFPPFLGFLGLMFGRTLEKQLELLTEQLNNISEGETPIDGKRLSREIRSELSLVREKVLKAHKEYNLVKQLHEEKMESIERLRKSLEQNAYNRLILAESQLENLKISKAGCIAEVELLERNFIYQTGYIIGGNLIDEILDEVNFRFSEVLLALGEAGAAENPLLPAAAKLNETERSLEKLQLFFEPFCDNSSARLGEVLETARNLLRLILKHRNIAVNSYIAEGVGSLPVCRELAKVSAAISCVLLNSAGISDGGEIVIDLAERSADRGRRNALITLTASQAKGIGRRSTAEYNEKLANLANVLPDIMKVLLKGSFRLHKSADSAIAEIEIEIPEEAGI